ncbi:uncharacterized protein LOC135464735 isoform X2 [Liolophura sinensis]|uniref:uncharacterized protein LOC135464735 isoform X2 n=1 Tax=Liolophura sinensis TaxID=3198878 RepID=UPI003159800D
MPMLSNSVPHSPRTSSNGHVTYGVFCLVGCDRFGVQPRNGIVVKVYDGRVWPVTVFGDVYITTEFTAQLVIHHLLSSSLPKKQLVKYTLAVGTSQGKIQRFLNDVEQPVRVLQDPQLRSADDVCFLIVKKPKAVKKPMFRSLSWASINKSASREQMNQGEGLFSTDGRKQKKYRLKKKKDGKITSSDAQGSSDTTSSEEYLHHIGSNLTSTPIKGGNFTYSNRHDKLVKGASHSNPLTFSNGQSTNAKMQSGNFAPSGMPQNSSLTSFYSCDDIRKAAPPSSDSESEMSSTEIVEDPHRSQPPKYSDHKSSLAQEQQEAEDTLSDLQVVLRTRSLGDLTTNQGLSLAAAPSGLRESWHEGEVQERYVRSAGSSRTVIVNPPTLKRDIPRQRPSRQNRRSCVARIEDKENHDYLEDFYGRSLQKTPRQRRSLPQIPNNDIDEKKRRFAELMMRRLTVCNGEIATYLQDSSQYTGSLNEIRDGRYISNAHIHLTPSDSMNSQPDLSPPSDQEFDPQNRYQGSPVPMISTPRSPESLLRGGYPQNSVRRRTPDPFNDSPNMQRIPVFQERETTHTPLSRIAKSDSRQYQMPRSRVALIDSQTDPDFHSERPPSYHGNNHQIYQGNGGHDYPVDFNYKRRPGPNYSGNYASGYYGNDGQNYQGSRESLYRGRKAHSYHGNITSNVGGNNPYGTLPRGIVNSGNYALEDLSQFSTFPRSDKNSNSNGNHGQRPPVISPGKPLSDTGSDPGQTNLNSRGSMVDSGYGTNGESDYGFVPGRPLHPQKVYAKEHHGKLKQSSNEFNKSPDGSFERNSLESPPDPVTTNPAPSFHQLLSACSIHAVRLTLPPKKVAADLIHIHEDSINLPNPRHNNGDKIGDSPKGRYALGLGGPGSAFRRVRSNIRDVKCYNLVSVENINKNCQPKQGEVTVDKGDFLIEINGQVTLGLDFSTVLSLLESVQGGQLELVVARRKPAERIPETLSSEISKLRQQCAYLITEVKSKEQIITDLSTVGHEESSPRQSQSLTLDPPISRQETYYTCELSDLY